MVLEVRGHSLSGKIKQGDKVEVDLNATSASVGSFIAYWNQQTLCLKELIGIPHNKLELNGNMLVVGDSEVKLQNSSQIHIWDEWINSFNHKIPEGFLFVAGTTDDSIDSRGHGLITFDQVVGVVINTDYAPI